MNDAPEHTTSTKTREEWEVICNGRAYRSVNEREAREFVAHATDKNLPATLWKVVFTEQIVRTQQVA